MTLSTVAPRHLRHRAHLRQPRRPGLPGLVGSGAQGPLVRRIGRRAAVPATSSTSGSGATSATGAGLPVVPSSPTTSEYRYIVPGQRIVSTYEMAADERRMSVSVATVEFHDQGASTRLILTEQGVFLDGHDTAAQREEGMWGLLESLARFLETTGEPRRPGTAEPRGARCPGTTDPGDAPVPRPTPATVWAFLRPPVTVVPAPADLIKDHDVPVRMRDGITLRANVYRPEGEGPFPVIMCVHPYGKDALPRAYTARSAAQLPVPDHAPVRGLPDLQRDGLGGAGPGGVGRAWLRRDQRRRPGAGTSGGVGSLLWTTRPSTSTTSSSGPGRSLGRTAGWGCWGLAPCHLAVQSCGAATPAPRRHLPVGGVHRRLPRLHDAGWGPRRWASPDLADPHPDASPAVGPPRGRATAPSAPGRLVGVHHPRPRTDRGTDPRLRELLRPQPA